MHHSHFDHHPDNISSIMASFQPFCVVALLVAVATMSSANPGGNAESYQQNNLFSHGGYSHEHYLDHHPKYTFKYGVEDHHTGDHKDAKEERDGDVVKGEYSLLQPDGRKRTVHYTASPHTGLNAHVSYSGHAVHPQTYHYAGRDQNSLFSHGGNGGYSHENYPDHHPKYTFKYGVEDHHTGDHKQANEERSGDVVNGEYSLLQPDGRKRTVHYTASPHSGFNAHVSYSGRAVHPQNNHNAHND